MPSSFSRFLDEEELQKAREMYLEALDALEEDDEGVSGTEDGEHDEGELPQP
ncbi:MULTISPECIES: hypothetical protein [unclassified Streptomyces]|uniref:hypothetical protein n=1 Tax=unclassified Streptomyces TaxID=2593676 RepID=UPI001652E41B|nr:hypothetical protein [Streptomyces sp. sk2.1]